MVSKDYSTNVLIYQEKEGEPKNKQCRGANWQDDGRLSPAVVSQQGALRAGA
jgi:hypothetical protein